MYKVTWSWQAHRHWEKHRICPKSVALRGFIPLPFLSLPRCQQRLYRRNASWKSLVWTVSWNVESSRACTQNLHTCPLGVPQRAGFILWGLRWWTLMYMYVCIYEHTGMRGYGGQRTTWSIHFQELFILFFEMGPSLGFPIRLGWLGSKSQSFSCLCLPSAGMTSTWHYVCFYNVTFGDWT